MSLDNIRDFLNTISHIPPLIDTIIDYTDNDIVTRYYKFNVNNNLKKTIIKRHTLIYGQIQSGKTQKIIDTIKKHNSYKIILVIQNSLLVLNQYISRFKSENLKLNIIDSSHNKLTNGINIILNNKHRKKYILNVNLNLYILFFDEADLTYKSFKPFYGFKRYYITATPFNMKVQFDNTIEITPPINYYGLNELTVNVYDNDYSNVFQDFIDQKSGILLITTFRLIETMIELSMMLSIKYPNLTFIVLNSTVKQVNNGFVKIIKKQSINKIIDNLQNESHIVFISHRLASRGLSFVSSDYKRHLTHQILKLNTNVVSNIQKTRLCGIYSSNLELKLYVNCLKLFEKTTSYLI